MEADSIALATSASFGKGVIATGLAATAGTATNEIGMKTMSTLKSTLFFTISTRFAVIATLSNDYAGAPKMAAQLVMAPKSRGLDL